MFYVVQKIFAADGAQIDSDTIAECQTEKEAGVMVDRLTAENGHVAPDGTYAQWHVEAE